METIGVMPRIDASIAARCRRLTWPGGRIVIPFDHWAVMRTVLKPASFARSICDSGLCQIAASSTAPHADRPGRECGRNGGERKRGRSSDQQFHWFRSLGRFHDPANRCPEAIGRSRYYHPSPQGEEPIVSVAQQTFHHLVTSGLDDVDPDIAGLLAAELERQRGQIELIASENFTWPSVLEAVGSVPTNKYAEGYPGKRYYGGCEVVDEIEQLAIDRAKELFGAEHANVQPHAGAQTNMAVYAAVLEPGDTILGLRLDHGGHLTHGHKVNFSGRLYTIAAYGVSRDTMLVDYDEVLRIAKEARPKLIVCGASAYPRTVETNKFREIADEVGALPLCDMAHFAGLVAAGLQPNPVPFDERPPTVASGIRIGTPAMTMRGFDEDDFREIGRIIVDALADKPDVDALRGRVDALCTKRPLYPGFRGYGTYVA